MIAVAKCWYTPCVDIGCDPDDFEPLRTTMSVESSVKSVTPSVLRPTLSFGIQYEEDACVMYLRQLLPVTCGPNILFLYIVSSGVYIPFWALWLWIWDNERVVPLDEWWWKVSSALIKRER